MTIILKNLRTSLLIVYTLFVFASYGMDVPRLEENDTTDIFREGDYSLTSEESSDGVIFFEQTDIQDSRSKIPAVVPKAREIPTTPRHILSPRINPAHNLKAARFEELDQMSDIFRIISQLQESVPTPTPKVEDKTPFNEPLDSPTQLENLLSTLRVEPLLPLTGWAILIHFDDCLSYLRPTNSALEELQKFDNTNYKDSETLIRLLGIEDKDTMRKIRYCCQDFQDPETIIRLAEVKDKITKRNIKQHFKKLQDHKSDSKKSQSRNTLISIKINIGKPVVEIIESVKPPVSEMREVNMLVTRAENTWIMYSKEMELEHTEYFSDAANDAGVSTWDYCEKVAQAKFDTKYQPVEDEIMWYLDKLKAMGATLVSYSVKPYDNRRGEFLKMIHFVDETENPAMVYCCTKDISLIEFIKRQNHKNSRILLVDNSLQNLSLNSRTLKEATDTIVDVLFYKRPLKLTTPCLLALQRNIVDKYISKTLK